MPVLGRSLRNKSSKDMAFPHPKSRKEHYRNDDKPNTGGVLWNFFKRTINITDRLRRPVGRFDSELLGVLRVQPLPAAEPHRLATNDAADGSSAEKVIQNIETNVPARGAPRDEAAIDVVPQRQARAATKGFEFPPDILAPPVVLKHLGSVG